ncbi:unnamed protein product [Camellia sinensis]
MDLTYFCPNKTIESLISQIKTYCSLLISLSHHTLSFFICAALRAPIDLRNRLSLFFNSQKSQFLQTTEETMEKREKTNKMGIVDKWLKKHSVAYSGATRHPFIHSIRHGTVDLSSFKRWLGQDYVFVRASVPFVASVLLKAWKESDDSSDVEVILGGVAAFNDELAWFKKEASKWDVSLSDVVPLNANLRYCSFLESLMSSDIEYTVAITAFWACETVYQDSFAHCLEDNSNTPEELRETCERWGNDGFGQYCLSLREIANRLLDKAPADVVSKAEVVFLRVLEYEVEFWNMSHAETSGLTL